MAASRLQQTEAAAWLQHELDGYDTFDELPAYRRPPWRLVCHPPRRGHHSLAGRGWRGSRTPVDYPLEQPAAGARNIDGRRRVCAFSAAA
ncbi:hypothetical protein [Aeromonas caviae]|uniref:AbiTii domain-containing protein n=1 Tax=Aeromonas caviae TaxID=648 RepID=UPI0024413DF7|nr:hypothetical protein [Aeromonas caviae]